MKKNNRNQKISAIVIAIVILAMVVTTIVSPMLF